MNIRKLVLGLVLMLALVLAACSSPAAATEVMADKEMAAAESSESMEAQEKTMPEEVDTGMADDEMASDHGEEAMTEDKSDAMMPGDDSQMDDHSDDAMMEEQDDGMSDDAMMMSPDWFQVSFTDVNSGEAFTIGDFKGKVVLVETLAMWCSNCLKQQGQVQALHGLLGERDDFVSLGVDIDPNENAEALQIYTAKNGFNWRYIVAPAEVSREIGQLYGDQFLNPPSTPMLIIDREGQVHLLPFGIKSAESLLEALQPFLDAEM